VAIQCFKQAIKLDPQYALAYAGLADSYGILRFYGWMAAEAGQPPAQAAMSQAVKLAPSLWEVNFSRGFYTFYFERAWREAEPHFCRAIAINPRSSLAQAYYALFLTAAGRTEAALNHTMVACQVDPLSAFAHCMASAVSSTAGRFDAGEREAQEALELQPGYLLGLWLRGIALSGLARHEEAVESLERAVSQSRAPIFVGLLGFGYARAGRHEDATRLLGELEDRGSRGEYIPSFAPLCINVGLADLPGTRAWLTKAIAEGAPPVTIRIACGHFLDELRSDPEVGKLHFEIFGW
jgi:tetratricopeptide (TPR) repeat protein